MANTESSVTPQSRGWARPFPRDERLFVVAIVLSTLAMAGFVIVWLFGSDHNVPTTFKRTEPAVFSKQVQAFADRYGAADGRVYVPPGTEAYLMAARYSWYPELALEAGKTYRIWMSSLDALHGFSLVGGGQNLNLEIVPNHAYAPSLTIGKPGRYLIVCNEYCGLHHHEMKGFIDVVSPQVMARHVQAQAPGKAGAPAAPAAGASLTLTADPGNALKFDKSALTARAGKVTISMANPSVLPHNMAIKGNGVEVKGKIVLHGGTSVVTTRLKPGAYTFYCSVPGHAAAGMKGTLTVKP